MHRKESVDAMKGRTEKFKRWLDARPEQFIIAFGHSNFWKAFSKEKKALDNCEFIAMKW